MYTTRDHSLGGRNNFTTSTLSSLTEYNRICFSTCMTFSSDSISGKPWSHLDTTEGLFDTTAARTASGTLKYVYESMFWQEVTGTDSKHNLWAQSKSNILKKLGNQWFMYFWSRHRNSYIKEFTPYCKSLQSKETWNLLSTT